MPAARLAAALAFLFVLCIAGARAVAPLPPRSGQLAFERKGGGSHDIWLLDVRSGVQINLTRDNPGYDGAPAWSPNGQQLAFVSMRNRMVSSVYRLDLKSRAVTAFNPIVPAFGPSWSPDGSAVIFTNMNNDLVVRDLRALTARRIARGAYAEWSPDGHALVYACADMTTIKLCLADAGGEDARFLIAGGVNYLSPDWSPDSRHIVAASTLTDNLDLFVLDSACLPACQAQARRLTHNDTLDYAPDWSPDGLSIVYVCAGSQGQHLCVVGADGSGARVLLDAPPGVRYDAPAWRPG
jgi:TolB protein